MIPDPEPKPVEPSPSSLEGSESSRDPTAGSAQGPKGYALHAKSQNGAGGNCRDKHQKQRLTG